MWHANRSGCGGCCYRGVKQAAAAVVCLCCPNTPALFLVGTTTRSMGSVELEVAGLIFEQTLSCAFKFLSACVHVNFDLPFELGFFCLSPDVRQFSERSRGRPTAHSRRNINRRQPAWCSFFPTRARTAFARPHSGKSLLINLFQIGYI